jgi:DNA-binding MarR family transcriptional regulator
MGASGSPPTGYLLTRIAQATSARFGERIEILGIRPKHFGLLLAVDAASASSADLARTLGVDPAAIVGMLDDLETRGAIVRIADPQSHHRLLVELTNEGRKMLETARRTADEVDAEVLGSLQEGQRTALDDALRSVAASPAAQNRLDSLD